MDRTKILIFLRVSTEAQELDEQKNEMISFAKSMGYTEDNIIFLEDKGASAIKLNEKYLNMITEVKKHIENKDISAVAVWAVNRLARNETVFFELKQLFIDNKIQFYVKNPSLTLLNEDGSVNAGSELALSLFATMSKQDMAEKQAKFKRTKHAYALQGKYVGGHTLRFGYGVDDNGFYVENEDSEIIKAIYELYSNGGYSFYTLAEEINNRGYKRLDGKAITFSTVSEILSSDAYTGKAQVDSHNRIYPALITEELFEKCSKIRENNRLDMRPRGNVIKFGSRIIKCPDCGGSFTSNSRHYSCGRHVKNTNHYCENSLCIKQNYMDKVLWRVAYICHMDYLLNMSEEKINEYRDKLKVIEKKISTTIEKIEGIDTKKKRVIDTFLEGYIDKKERDLRLSKIDSEAIIFKDDLTAQNESKNAINGLIEKANGDNMEDILTNAMDVMDADEDSYNRMSEIIHQHIIKCTPTAIKFPCRSREPIMGDAIELSIDTVEGYNYKFVMILKGNKKDILFVWNGKKWVEDRY